jgi:hypothetical protein
MLDALELARRRVVRLDGLVERNVKAVDFGEHMLDFRLLLRDLRRIRNGWDHGKAGHAESEQQGGGVTPKRAQRRPRAVSTRRTGRGRHVTGSAP